MAKNFYTQAMEDAAKLRAEADKAVAAVKAQFAEDPHKK